MSQCVPLTSWCCHILIHFAIPYGLATDEIILRDATCVHEGIGISTSITTIATFPTTSSTNASRSSTSIATAAARPAAASTQKCCTFLGSFAMTHDSSLRKWPFVNTNTLSPRISNFETHESMKPGQTVSHTVALHISYKFMRWGGCLFLFLWHFHMPHIICFILFHYVSNAFHVFPTFLGG